MTGRLDHLTSLGGGVPRNEGDVNNRVWIWAYASIIHGRAWGNMQGSTVHWNAPAGRSPHLTSSFSQQKGHHYRCEHYRGVGSVDRMKFGVLHLTSDNWRAVSGEGVRVLDDLARPRRAREGEW